MSRADLKILEILQELFRLGKFIGKYGNTTSLDEEEQVELAWKKIKEIV